MCITENRVYLAQIDPAKKVVLWTRPDCHMWSCKDCAETNKRRWTAIVAHGIEEYQQKGINDWRFVTITSHEKLKTFDQTLWVWRKAWPKLYGRMKRAAPDMKYAFLPEKHRDGRMHMHAICSGGISTRWLKDNARSCGFGYKSESEEIISIPLACFYVLKYVTKSLTERAQWPKSLHRVRTSQKWPKSLDSGEFQEIQGDFEIVTSSDWPDKSAKLTREGYVFTNIKTGEIEGTTF